MDFTGCQEGVNLKKGLIKVPGQCCSCGTVILVCRDTACGGVDAVEYCRCLLLRNFMFRGAEQELSFPPVLTQSSEPSQDLSNQSLEKLNSFFFLANETIYYI